MTLAYAGYRKLRPGKIHVFCPHCGRKFSNIPREDYDPPSAVLMHLCCDRCGQGCKIDGPDCYYDANGKKTWSGL